MRRSHCCRSAFTLIELLIVISIISLLVALMIPAVQMARESARRSQCANNLRQFGVAMAGFESQNGRFPSSMTATLKGPLFADPEFHLSSYMIDLLPMLGVGALADEYDAGKMFNAPANTTAIARAIHVGLCPSSPARDEAPEDEIVVSLTFTRSVRENSIFSKVAKQLDDKYSGKFNGGVIDYSIVINADKGVAERHGYQLLEKEKALGLRSMFPVPIESTDDLLRQIVPVTLGPATLRLSKGLRTADITDGLSKTFMMTEIGGRPQHWESGKHVGTGEPVRGAWADPRSIIEISGTGPDLCLMQCDNNNEIYSFHGDNVHFLFADGHVDSLNRTVDPKLILSLMTPNKGEKETE